MDAQRIYGTHWINLADGLDAEDYLSTYVLISLLQSPDGILNRVRCHRRIAILACRLWREALACAFRSRVCRQGYQSSMGRIFGIRRLAGRQAVSIELAETPLELQFDD